MEVPESVELRQSLVHGLGVFAKKSMEKDFCIGSWTGTKMTKSEFKEKYGDDISYTYWTAYNFKTKKTISVAKDSRNWITYINESLAPNVYLKNYKLWALRPILENEELFLRYNAKYPRDYIL